MYEGFELIEKHVRDDKYLGLMQVIDFKSMIQLMGIDCTIYVMFTKYAATMFFILCLTQSCLLMPLYYTGDGYL